MTPKLLRNKPTECGRWQIKQSPGAHYAGLDNGALTRIGDDITHNYNKSIISDSPDTQTNNHCVIQTQIEPEITVPAAVCGLPYEHRNVLKYSILFTVFGFWPIGIYSIVCAIKSRRAFANGDIETCNKFANKAANLYAISGSVAVVLLVSVIATMAYFIVFNNSYDIDGTTEMHEHRNQNIEFQVPGNVV